MRLKDNDPPEKLLRAVETDEERRVLDDPEVPEEVKTEVFERLRRRHDAELEDQILDEPLEDEV